MSFKTRPYSTEVACDLLQRVKGFLYQRDYSPRTERAAAESSRRHAAWNVPRHADSVVSCPVTLRPDVVLFAALIPEERNHFQEPHRRALIVAATSGDSQFFLGTDSAPHPRRNKEAARGCAGIYTADAAIELYAEVFEQADALDRLKAVASFHDADFYRLRGNLERITLVTKPWQVATAFGEDDDSVIPLRANETVAWQLAEVESK